MFAIKDLESLKNLSTVMVIPCFAAAYVSDGAQEAIRDPVLNWMRESNYFGIQFIGWVMWLLIVVTLVGAVVALLDYCVVWLQVKTGEVYLMVFLGFACLTAGLLVLSLVMPGLPKSPLNPLWHFALLCYGFSLIERASK